MLVPAGSRVTAYVTGAYGNWLGNASGQVGSVTAKLSDYGRVVDLAIVRGWFASDYQATLEFRTSHDHGTWADIAATIAGCFEVVMGARPSVRIVQAQDAPAPPVPDTPSDDIPWGAIALGVTALAVIVVIAAVD